MKVFVGCIVMFCLISVAAIAEAQTVTSCDQICGKWMSDEKNLAVQIYREHDDFVARIIWFYDEGDKGHPMESWTDVRNPDVKLRARKLLGMNVVENLVYNAKSNSWEEGLIYDAKHGKIWNAAATLTKQGQLKVTGYWHFKFIGKTLTFNKVSNLPVIAGL